MLVAGLAWAGYARRAVPTNAPERAFYYWRTTWTLSDVERDALATLGVRRLYVRVFDVESAVNGPRAIAKLDLAEASALSSELEIVPVVYLHNEVLQHVEPGSVRLLAELVWHEVQTAAGQLPAPKELQLDCDWSDSTRERYFALLGDLRAALPQGTTLSATIRLHQIKFRERTGVPPVERGMLMFYNMGSFGADADSRAIFDPEQAERYLARLAEYPLPLDAALPIWSWTLQLRNEQVEGLLQATDPAELEGKGFLRRLDSTRFEVTRSTFLHGHLLRAGDQLKGEVTGPEQTQAAAALLANHLGATPGTVAIFDLSDKNLRRHNTDTLERVFEALR